MATLSRSRPALNRRTLLAALAGSSLAPALPVRLAHADGAADNAALAEVLRKAWEGRYAGKAGGLTMIIQSPKQGYFASTIPGVTETSFFRGASITKTFTAASIMLLDAQGKLRIDDRIADPMPGRSEPYLPEGAGYAIPYRDQITIRQLLSHRAGVFDLANMPMPKDLAVPYAGEVYTDWRVAQDPEHTFTPDELIGVLATTQVSRNPPGDAQHYSDTHYTLLERIVQNVSGLPLDEFKQQEFLVPNGLVNTHFVVDGKDSKLPSPAIAGHNLDSNGVTLAQDYNYTYDPGSGNLVTTPADLVRWIRRLIRGEAGLPESQVTRMMDMAEGSDYGLGILRKSSGDVFLGYGHNGGTAGYLTDALHNPDNDVSYVLQSSLIDFIDLGGELDWLGVVAKDALQRLGLV